ncbi:cytochrome c/c1 heme-lyase [Piptocephalis cylindrospora]|uniref:Holocytochrome c-type synthase n=1 Tax=Piptocephalis cylindrospora TaxID=1907219 RepID=A0A4V1IYA9_9FUNG|nr:cytochrome c/c1 heme-lyase [Piptocephalis cylindrospora]|eukprot:RKP13919.1 cytochrome c/c1 heme-lyase [Piptocephalis cylindrospora]
MPSTANQTPAQNQRIPLSKDRAASTIPMSEEGAGVWMYPSEQMFFNAMRRKQWDAREQDMGVIVPMHNAVNERCWQEILLWEKNASSPCGQPKLTKFIGRPQELSPKARILTWLGYKAPFDRHDWYVDRCGTPVRYIIDFYTGKAPPKGSPLEGLPSFYLDVRPEVSVAGVFARAKRLWQDYC